MEVKNIKRILNIEISSDCIKINFLRKNKKNIYIDKSIVEKIDFNFIENINYNYQINDISKTLYVERASKLIKEHLESSDKSYKEIYYNIQNENIIIRNIDPLKVKIKKDLLGLIEFEIMQYMPINISNYLVKYRTINLDRDKVKLQVILFPKYIIEICKNISTMLNMKPKVLNVDFDILQKLIDIDLIENFKGNGIFIESKNREFILNLVKDKMLYESYTLQRTIQSYEYITSLKDKFKDVYYYGEEDPFVKKYCFGNFNAYQMKLNENIRFINESFDCENVISKYINSIGMII